MTSSTRLTRRATARFRWWPLYLIGVLAVLLIAGDWALPLPELWRSLLLLPTTCLVCALALRWAARTDGPVASEGADARVRDDPVLRGIIEQASGVELAPQTSLFVIETGDES